MNGDFLAKHCPLGMSRHVAAAMVLAAVAIGLSTPARAEYRGTPQQQATCRPDVFRLCPGEIPYVSRIVACLKRAKNQLSPPCRAVFDGAGQ